MNELYYEHAQIAQHLSDDRLIDRIENLEKLLDNDDFIHSSYIDDAFVLYDVFRDECVRRVKYGICLKDVGKSL